MPDHIVRVAVVGAGSSLLGFHYPIIRALPSQFVLHSVVERSGKGTCRQHVGDNVKVVRTLDEALQDPEVDLVVISTPNKTHNEYCTRALEKGKHGEQSKHTYLMSNTHFGTSRRFVRH